MIDIISPLERGRMRRVGHVGYNQEHTNACSPALPAIDPRLSGLT